MSTSVPPPSFHPKATRKVPAIPEFALQGSLSGDSPGTRERFGPLSTDCGGAGNGGLGSRIASIVANDSLFAFAGNNSLERIDFRETVLVWGRRKEAASARGCFAACFAPARKHPEKLTGDVRLALGPTRAQAQSSARDARLRAHAIRAKQGPFTGKPAAARTERRWIERREPCRRCEAGETRRNTPSPCPKRRLHARTINGM